METVVGKLHDYAAVAFEKNTYEVSGRESLSTFIDILPLFIYSNHQDHLVSITTSLTGTEIKTKYMV